MNVAKQPAPRVTCRVFFEKRDLWVGVYWRTLTAHWISGDGVKIRQPQLQVFLCLVPCLPILIQLSAEPEHYG